MQLQEELREPPVKASCKDKKDMADEQVDIFMTGRRQGDIEKHMPRCRDRRIEEREQRERESEREIEKDKIERESLREQSQSVSVTVSLAHIRTC